MPNSWTIRYQERVESFDGGVSLARALLAVARTHRSGVLTIDSELGPARVWLSGGAVVGISGGPASSYANLGDLLVAAGELDPVAHRAVLERAQPRPGEPIGDWLVRERLCSRAALARALRVQLRQRVTGLLGCESLRYRLDRGNGRAPTHLLFAPEPTAPLVAEALRQRLRRAPLACVARAIPTGRARLSTCGQALVGSMALSPQEQTASALLSHGADLATVVGATCGSERAMRWMATLALLGLLSHGTRGRSHYAALLRKQRQLRAAAPPHVLLDTSLQADAGEARRALRRLARELHPDRFGPDAPAEVRSASHEVMSALIAAEHALTRRAAH